MKMHEWPIRIYHLWLTLVIVAGTGWLVQTEAGAVESGEYQHHLLLMRYDAGRDVHWIETAPFMTHAKTTTPQQYADALAAQPEMSFTTVGQVGQRTWYRDPIATVRGDTLTVNYRDACTDGSMASTESMRFWGHFASWFWVPGIRQVHMYANDNEVTWVGEEKIDLPLVRQGELFTYHPNTREVGVDKRYTTKLPSQATLTDALRALRECSQHRTSRRAGFEPLLPPDITVITPEYPHTPLARSGGVLHLDFPNGFPRYEQGRLAGMVLLLTQLPEVDAVRFTFGSHTVHERFMHTTLDQPITSYCLDLPTQRIQSIIRFACDIHPGDAITLVTDERTAALTSLEYARALATNPAMQWTPTAPGAYRLVNPQVALRDDTLNVQYTVEGHYSMSSAELTGLWAMLEAWWWVPGIRDVALLDQHRNPLAIPEFGTMESPTSRRYHNYAYLADRDTMGYLIGTAPQSLQDALDQLTQQTAISPRALPLLPEGTRITADPQTMTDGILTVDLSSKVHHDYPARLAGMVMMLAQFLEVQAVRFTFNGQSIAESFMRTSLDQPISPYDLEFRTRSLPPVSALLIDGQTYVPVRPLIERFGGRIWYNPRTRDVRLTLGERSVVLMADNSAIRANGSLLWLQYAPRLIAGQLFAPVRPVCEALGLVVTWTGINRDVNIRHPASRTALALPVSPYATHIR